MSKVLVLYYSAYGHIEIMAGAIAEGAREAGAQVDVRRVPEITPEEIARNAHFKLDQAAPIATVAELANYDAIIVGSPTRFGRISSPMASLLDQAGGLWMHGTFHGKVGGAFASTGRNHSLQHHHQLDELRDGHRRYGFRLPRTEDHRRGHRRQPVRRHDDRRA
jgi:NAD(P)H dehydrogenase (quinone)